MALETDDVYTLSDLLQTANQLMSEKKLRKFSFIFSKDMSFHVERTDARTNRIKYYHIEHFQQELQNFYHPDKATDAFNDLYTDIKYQLNRINATGTDALSESIVELHEAGVIEPVEFRVNAGGYRYNKVVEVA